MAKQRVNEYKNNVDEERTYLEIIILIGGSDTRRTYTCERINTRVKKDVMGDKELNRRQEKNMKPLGTWVVTLPQKS